MELNVNQIVSLTNGGFAFVDAGSIGSVESHRWYRDASGYARCYVQTSTGRQAVLMHRMVLAAPPGTTVDQGVRRRTHNGEGRRLVTKQWVAEIGIRGRRVHLGYFATEADAARAYDKAALERFGSFARPNFFPE